MTEVTASVDSDDGEWRRRERGKAPLHIERVANWQHHHAGVDAAGGPGVDRRGHQVEVDTAGTHDGNALAEALALARQIAGFPQACLRADRASALAQWDWPLATALQRDGAGGFAALQAEGLAGAARFAAGAGRHGAGTGP